MIPIDALRRALAIGDPFGSVIDRPAENSDPAYPIWRFLHAWRASASTGHRLGADHAVLLRQIARWHDGELHTGPLPHEIIDHANKAGVSVSPAGILRARPFAPTWLREVDEIEDDGLDTKPTLRRLREAVPGEPYLKSLGLDHWNSPAQREAAWLSLTAPSRSTSLVALPTGAGKSLCFQLLARFNPGRLIVIVVPTVALAIDHWTTTRAMLANLQDVRCDYYASGEQDGHAEAVLEAIRGGGTRVLFTSPEAVTSGKLRNALADAATRGEMCALVIDEAHLVESWGVYFRVDFQLLSILRRQWLNSPDAEFRTLLLSATFTPDCRRILRQLFSEPGTVWRELISQRIRPEISYFVRSFPNEDERLPALCDCLWMLPRPAVFYTTRRDQAKRMAAWAADQGFTRIGCFHGETPSAKRRLLLDRWRTDEIDVMFATSAFGLGVDKQDVRSIVHACLPEDVHRYYQEVGRSGRDGNSAICVLLPLRPADWATAQTNRPKLLRPETLQGRWQGMWRTAVHLPDGDWRLRLDAKPTWLLGDRTGRRHVAWNKRLLLQLVRAGHIALVDVTAERADINTLNTSQIASPEGFVDATAQPDADVEQMDLPEDDDISPEYLEVATIELNFPAGPESVAQRIAVVRAIELSNYDRGLQSIEEFVDGDKCIGSILQRVYGDCTRYACGGCPSCRRRRRKPHCPPLPVSQSVETKPQYTVIGGIHNPVRAFSRHRFASQLRQLLGRDVRRVLCPARHGASLLESCADAFDRFDWRSLYRVDATDDPRECLIEAHETFGVLHINKVWEAALRLRRGAHVLHLLTHDTPSVGVDGRRLLEVDGVPYYPTFEQWLEVR